MQQEEKVTARTLRVCLAQLSSVVGDVPTNRSKMVKTVTEHAKDTDLMIFHELVLTGYPTAKYPFDKNKFASLAETSDGETFKVMSALAKLHSCGIIYGYPELDGEKRYISSKFLDKQGKEIGNYRKTHLWDPFAAFERDIFAQGDSLSSAVVEFERVKIGMLICWDFEFPEPSRCLALAGAEIIVAIACNADKFVMSHITSVRAFENLLHVIYVNAADAPFCGMSTVCAPTGKVLVQHALEESFTHITIDADSKENDIVRKRNPFYDCRRPDLYRSIA